MTATIKNLTDAALYYGCVSGLTHDFYKYPARFSPEFVRSAIQNYSKPGDLIIDPFVGGGTTLVEAMYASRNAVGYDINELAVFLSRVKTTCLTSSEICDIQNWSHSLLPKLNLHNKPKVDFSHQIDVYLKHMYLRQTWPVRKLTQLYIGEIQHFDSVKIKDFLRVVLLKTLQWAIDGKLEVSSIKKIRKKLFQNLNFMIKSIISFQEDLNNFSENEITKIDIHHKSAEFIKPKDFSGINKIPKLVITSPPYPGVHVLYHRWQVFGRKETALPYVIANCYDGKGEAYYTLGNRNQPQLTNYWQNIYKIFSALTKVISEDTLIIQMIAFSDVHLQLAKYLQVMNDAGYKEVGLIEDSSDKVQRIWRNIPNRKWYNYNKANIDSRKEVLLFHKIN